jgi:hypothetical protein
VALAIFDDQVEQDLDVQVIAGPELELSRTAWRCPTSFATVRILLYLR